MANEYPDVEPIAEAEGYQKVGMVPSGYTAEEASRMKQPSAENPIVTENQYGANYGPQRPSANSPYETEEQYREDYGPQKPTRGERLKQQLQDTSGKVYGYVEKKYKESTEDRKFHRQQEELKRKNLQEYKASPEGVKEAVRHKLYLEETRASKQPVRRKEQIQTKTSNPNSGRRLGEYTPAVISGGRKYTPAYEPHQLGKAEHVRISNFGSGPMPKIGSFMQPAIQTSKPTYKVPAKQSVQVLMPTIGGSMFKNLPKAKPKHNVQSPIPKIGSGLFGNIPKPLESVVYTKSKIPKISSGSSVKFNMPQILPGLAYKPKQKSISTKHISVKKTNEFNMPSIMGIKLSGSAHIGRRKK